MAAWTARRLHLDEVKCERRAKIDLTSSWGSWRAFHAEDRDRLVPVHRVEPVHDAIDQAGLSRADALQWSQHRLHAGHPVVQLLLADEQHHVGAVLPGTAGDQRPYVDRIAGHIIDPGLPLAP